MAKHFNTIRVYKSTPHESPSNVQCVSMKSVGERIRQARDERRLSGAELAQRVGYKNQSAIGNLENRAGGTGGKKIAQIARALDVPVEWLLNGPDGVVPPPAATKPPAKSNEFTYALWSEKRLRVRDLLVRAPESELDRLYRILHASFEPPANDPPPDADNGSAAAAS
jgi:transcriptional regulator with XRE-family HTH domain